MTEKFSLSKKPILEGLSRGGLIIFNWAARNPEKVTLVYGDAAVCDYTSWPKWTDRQYHDKCLKGKGADDHKSTAYKPIDNLEPLAKAKVPILMVCGDADNVVPIKENTLVIEERYKKLGGKIKVITKTGCNHHPHGLKDPRPAVDFLVAHMKGMAEKQPGEDIYRNITLAPEQWK